MSEEIIELIEVNFDNTENYDTFSSKRLALFGANEKQTAHGVCADWIKKNLNKQSMYLGYDGNIYPQYQLKRTSILREVVIK